ncbi:hypothetical protein STEG23_012658 [Scotinomys teguina]
MRMNSKAQKMKLNDGHSIPILGFGTYAAEEHLKIKSMDSTKIAIDVGFRHIDCSHFYQNEEEAMEKCKDAGLTKSIGVSNFNHRQLEMILNKPGLKYKPVCNQVECHLYLNQSKLLDYCKMNDIILVAYGALGTQRYKTCVNEDAPVLLDNPVLGAIARKYKRTPAQIALRYQLQRGIVVLAKSFNEERIRENMQVFDFQLASEHMKVLDGLNRNFRYFPADMYFEMLSKGKCYFPIPTVGA